ncbi:MAG TPA: mechanosensitive ion channel family protein [Pyrinomonadaceae bacterium]|jgi:small-conductance mechanosensitive channel/CRP-like cAMP-binding protein|nr:mechanosensitive ion channel family protein [Pyrinomonadaceae bacterium]
MADPTFKRKAIFFLLFTGIITILLVTLPVISETLFQNFLLTQFGLSVVDGKLVTADGQTAPMMAQTWFELWVNVFNIIEIILWMALVIAIVRFVGLVIFATTMRKSGQHEIASLVRTVLSIIIYIVAFFIIFQSQYPSVQLAPLFTGSAIIGIVVGLALQDTLGNLFAGIALQADRPFQVGDVISIPSQGTGTVEAVSWRGVKIRTFQSKLLVISNAVLGKATIEVAPRDNLNARLVNFSTLYAISPTKTAQLIREAVRSVENVSNKVRPIVRIRNLGESGVEWEIKYWLEDYSKYNDTDSQVRQRVWYAFKRESIDFAFPTRTVHMEPRPEALPVDVVIDQASEHLTSVPVFTPLSEEEIERLARASVKRTFAPGEPIVRRGQEGRSMFVIVRGNVKVQVPGANGQQVINRLATNDFFGEMSLLTGEPRSATVVAEDEVDVLEIRKGALKPIFESNPELMESVVEIIEERKQLLTANIHETDEGKPEPAQGVLSSIRRFFGIK